MSRKLRQTGAGLYQYQNLILSAEEPASCYGWGFSPADFFVPCISGCYKSRDTGHFCMWKEICF